MRNSALNTRPIFTSLNKIKMLLRRTGTAPMTGILQQQPFQHLRQIQSAIGLAPILTELGLVLNKLKNELNKSKKDDEENVATTTAVVNTEGAYIFDKHSLVTNDGLLQRKLDMQTNDQRIALLDLIPIQCENPDCWVQKWPDNKDVQHPYTYFRRSIYELPHPDGKYSFPCRICGTCLGKTCKEEIGTICGKNPRSQYFQFTRRRVLRVIYRILTIWEILITVYNFIMHNIVYAVFGTFLVSLLGQFFQNDGYKILKHEFVVNGKVQFDEQLTEWLYSIGFLFLIVGIVETILFLEWIMFTKLTWKSEYQRLKRIRMTMIEKAYCVDDSNYTSVGNQYFSDVEYQEGMNDPDSAIVNIKRPQHPEACRRFVRSECLC